MTKSRNLRPPRRYWTEAELELLRQLYPECHTDDDQEPGNHEERHEVLADFPEDAHVLSRGRATSVALLRIIPTRSSPAVCSRCHTPPG